MHFRLTSENPIFIGECPTQFVPLLAVECRANYNLHLRCTYGEEVRHAMTVAIVPNERSSIAKAAQARDKPAKPYEVRAEKPLGLLLRVQPSGAPHLLRAGRSRPARPIGPAGTYTLKQAEERAKLILRDPEAALKQAGAGTHAGRIHRPTTTPTTRWPS